MLAAVSGIDVNWVLLWAFGVGSVIAGLAGLLMALDIDMTPSMGLAPLMLAVVAVMMAGVRSILGIALGSLVIAAAQQLGTWLIGSEWQDASALVILLAILLVKRGGVFNGTLKAASV